MSYYDFSYHRGRLLNQGNGSSKQKGGPPKRREVESGHRFIPVTVEPTETHSRPTPISEGSVEVELPFGIILRFKGVRQ